jgi:preprotein translocase SecE subunit
MNPDNTATVERKERRMPPDEHEERNQSPTPAARPREGGGWFRQYKPEQGKATRMGTIFGGGAVIAWGAIFLYERLDVYSGDEGWRLLITTGIPILFAVAMFAVLWWTTFVSRTNSDFMIATEGEMKKVNWSTRREIIGSTKVVILFTILFAVFLFVVDLVFQFLFSAIGVLKK